MNKSRQHKFKFFFRKNKTKIMNVTSYCCWNTCKVYSCKISSTLIEK